MIRTVRHIVAIIFCNLLLIGNAAAQRVNFGLYATEDIVITPLDLGELNFNAKEMMIMTGQTVAINLLDESTAVLAITGRRDQDFTVTVDAPVSLDLDTLHIPLNLRYAYSNMGATNNIQAKQTSVVVPAGFTSVTFPVLRRASGLPAPPPTPNHAGYVAPTGTVYFFIYGILGPVPLNAIAGPYSGQINIHVSYSVN